MKKNLILLHGALGHADNFNQIAEDLKNEYQIYSLLFKGHGTENGTSKSFFIKDLVAQLHSFIQENDIENPNIFGYSLGGYVALYYALEYPDTIQSIITLATKLAWSPEIAEQEVRFLNPEIILEKVPKYAMQLEQTHGENWQILLKQIADLMLDIGSQNYLNETTLPQINIPVQIMVGDQDKQVSVSESKWAADLLPNSKFVLLSNTEHPFEKVDKEVIKQKICDFH